jgi:hypothetical protein
MNTVNGHFEAELPFWLCIDDGDYDILIDGKPCLANGKPWKIGLSNDKWLIEMGNVIDGQTELVAITTTNNAKKFDKILPGKPYYHKTKMRTVLEMGWAWNIHDKAIENDARIKMKKEWNWCTQSFIKSVNRFIEIYRTSGIKDKIPTTLDTYDLSFNWWHTLLLDNKLVERVRLGLDAYPVIRNPPLKIDKRVQNEIAQKLKTDYVPPSWLLTIENAFGFHRRGKYRMAIVEMYTGFEIFVMEYLRIKFEKKKYDKNLIDYLMNRNELNHMLNHGLRLCVGTSFPEIDIKLWSLWDNQKNGVRQLRHDIIHNGQLVVTKDESENALNVINQMIQILKKI